VPLGVRDLLGEHAGVVAGTLAWQPKANGWYDNEREIFAEVTPWQVLAKVGYFGTLVWVTSLATGKPVANVRLRFYRAPHKTPTDIAVTSIAGVTNDDGVAILPGTVALGAGWSERWQQHERDWYLGATQGADMALLPLNWSYQRDIGEASAYSFYGRTAAVNGHLRAWALTAQGIYLPGATVHYSAFARGVGITALTPAPGLRYTLTISDPTGKNILVKDGVSLSKFGGIDGDLYIPKTAATGWYDIVLGWPTADGPESRLAGRFLVTSFVPASFKVSTLLEGALFAPGDAVKVQAQARLHAGGPYTQAAVKFDLRLEARPFAPDTPVAAGFSFDVNPDDAPDSLTLYQTQDKLDAAGNAKMQFTLPGKAPILYGHLVAQSAVESARGSWVANRATAIWAARDRFVGLRLDDWLLTAGKTFKVHFLVVDAAGKPQAGSVVQINLQRQMINAVQVADGAGNFRPEQKTTWVDESHCDATSTSAPGACRLTPAHAGAYRVVASVADTRGAKQETTLDSWAVGPGVVLWKTGKHVTLVPDKNQYHVGDTVRVLVQNPYPGARALVTVERYGILWQKVVTLATATPVLEIPVARSFFPGAYLSVAIFSPRVAKPTAADLGKPTLALGYVALPVVGAGSSLAIAVKPARRQYKPREEVNVNVAVKDAKGKPAAHTRLVVAVVDEAVLDLLAGGSDNYDPRKVFYAPPDGPDMLNYSLIGQLVTTKMAPMLLMRKGTSPGGGGGKGLSVRSLFKYTAYWQPDLETDAQGRAKFQFKLPDNLTGWRILVTALTPGAAMGLGQSTVRVNLPLQLEAALPNVVRAGDRFDAGFSVTNRTTKKQQVAVNISAQGAGIAGAKSSGTLDLASYAHDIAWLNLAPQIPGSISLLAQARAGKLGDALQKHIPVETAGMRETAAAYGSLTEAAANVPVKLPANALTGSGRLAIALAPTELANLAGAFEHMYEDPLETWEVRLSRGVMASNYLALKDALPASVKWPDAAGDIADTLKHATDFQAPNGGMAFWIPRNDFVSPYLSVYTALAFNWLATAGHPVPADLRSSLDDYLKDDILKATASATEAQAAPILKAGAMAALAGHDALLAGSVAGLLPQLDRLDLFGKSLLLQAAVATKDTASAHRIVTSILAHAEETSGSISFQETEADAYLSLLASPLRSNCAVLDALVTTAKAGGDNAKAIGMLPAKLMRWIDARRGADGGWPNSQENVFCTTAEAHYAKAYEGPVVNLGGSVVAAGKAIGRATFASRRSAPQSLSATAPATAATVAIEHSGEGRLYYGVSLSWTRPAQAIAPANAGFTVRRAYRVQRNGDWLRVTPTTQLARGDIVRVDLLVDVPAERHYVVLTDPLPGGFEAVNHQLATSDANTPEQTPGETTLWFDYSDWPNYSIVSGGFYHRETAFDAVRFYADILPAGHYHLIYAVQVITPGRFLAPPPQAHEIYQPDVFGRGALDTISVAAPSATNASHAASP
ncbi:MAG: alpha-2-macroglobulin family protein, partial [Gammaproteobacteria bacterium]